MTYKEMDFYTFLIAFYNPDKTPGDIRGNQITDLAYDAKKDKRFKKHSKTKKSTVEYLEKHSHKAAEIAGKLWDLYKSLPA